MASNFLYLLLKYAPNSGHLAALLKYLFKFLQSILKYLKTHKWIAIALIVAISAICLLPFFNFPTFSPHISSLKIEDDVEDITVNLYENDESEYEVLQFSPDMLTGIEEFNITLPDGLQELICYEDSCYMVVDSWWDWGKGYVPTRRLVTHSFDMAVITASEIKMEGDILNTTLSKNWSVKKETIIGPYLKVMTTAPFITKTLSMDKMHPNILLIGLGGSSINNFFSQLANEPNVTVVDLMPAMKVIAKKWFGLKENDRHRVIVGDGAKFVQERSDSEPKFDVILLDACYDDPPENIVCPVDIFHDDEIIGHIHRNLKENGTLVINVVLMNSDLTYILSRLIQKYEKHFGSCYFAHINHQLVLTCTPSKSTRMNDQEYYRRYKENVPEDLQDMLIERVHIRQDLFPDNQEEKSIQNEF